MRSDFTDVLKEVLESLGNGVFRVEEDLKLPLALGCRCHPTSLASARDKPLNVNLLPNNGDLNLAPAQRVLKRGGDIGEIMPPDANHIATQEHLVVG